MISSAKVKEKLDSIADAIEDIRLGKVVIVVDDEDRENEGDFITAARNATPEVINFMSKYGRGLICTPITEAKCDELELEMMVSSNTALHQTPFTVSIDLLGYGCTTGISAHDRSKTVKALIDPTIKASELGRPGHIFPLKARNGGVLRRTGHTEATVDLAVLAGFEPAGVLVEIMNEDGSMARLPELFEIAERFDLKVISIKDLVAYRLQNETLVEEVSRTALQSDFGDFELIGFREKIEKRQHLALVKGTWKTDEEVPVRVHSCNIISDIFSANADQHSISIQKSMEIIAREGKGVLVYMNHLEPGGGILHEMQEFSSRGLTESSSASAKSMDHLDFGIGAQILRSLGVSKMNLITNHATKRTAIEGYGLDIVSTISSK
jgi:3,4-dihydroxy 2-butanone 4-phosphate synthase/GTP cyclohydrolase II